jgi:2'-5' RNA ligase
MDSENSVSAIRAFVAVRMGEAIEQAVAAFQDSLRRLGADVAWTKPDNFHLTLRFLGTRVAPGPLAAIQIALARMAANIPPFPIEVSGAGAFPSLARPRVIWVGLRSDGLKDLAGAVESLAVASGLPAETRPYTPHLTIGRVRAPQRVAVLRQPLAGASQQRFGTARIDEVLLYQSLLSPQGANYRVLARFALVGHE